MSFIYPRVVAFHRPGVQSGIGAQAYGGQTLDTETEIVAGIPCSIQERREGTNNPVGLPGDGTKPNWWVLTPRRALAVGVVKNRDIMIDDLGNRFMVVAAYVDSLGGRLSVETLQS